MMQRWMIWPLAPLLAVAGCGDLDRRPGEEPSQAVDMDTVGWFQEGRVVEHAGERYVLVGPPVYEPLALTRVGDFEDTPLYAERGVASPRTRLFVPLGGGYWQMLEQAAGELAPAPTSPDPLMEGEDPDTIAAPVP